jgi:ribosomal protein S15P/S13E
MSFEQHIQQWVSIDNQMKQLTEKIKELRDKKSTLNDAIFNHVDNSNLSNATVQISDGKIKFVKTKDTQVLTFKYLETCLHEIIKNEEQVNKIIEYIKNKREVKYVSEIKRFLNN